MENKEENEIIKPSGIEDSILDDPRYLQLVQMLEVTFTKDEVENFYAKFDNDPFRNISAA